MAERDGVLGEQLVGPAGKSEVVLDAAGVGPGGRLAGEGAGEEPGRVGGRADHGVSAAPREELPSEFVQRIKFLVVTNTTSQ